MFPTLPPERIMVWGTPQTAARPDLSGLGTPGEAEGLVPSQPFEGWRAGRIKTYATKHQEPE